MTKKYILTGDVCFGSHYQITNTETGHVYKNNNSGKKEICDLLNELHEDYDKLFKFVVVMNRQINNSIVISDQFKEAWNHVLKKVVGELDE